ncbi:MAG: LptA/OstA family protein [Planctomycetaceae bacterium]|nr:LptA/OstA family protein [Planctomycetaceae bacterium]
MRTKATLSSFVLVLALYFVYGWGLVPLVLPNPSSNDIVHNQTETFEKGSTVRSELGVLLELLPPDRWERDPTENIHMLQRDNIILLFGRDEPDGRLLALNPCTILILPEGADYQNEASREQIQQSVVLRATRAEIEFTENVDIGKFSLPDIDTGRLIGNVTIQKGEKNSGKHDDFFLKTDDITITEAPGLTLIKTFGKVDFALGLHTGHGSGLVLELTPPDATQPQAPKELRSARFTRLNELRLVFPENVGPPTTLDVRCQGGFAFVDNPAEQGWTATFLNNVVMDRTNPDKTVDRLTAEEVHLTLTKGNQTQGTVATGKQSSPFADLDPALFVARGKAGQGTQAAVPARLFVAQDGGVTLVGDEIYLDLRKKFLSLSTRKGAGASPHVEMILADQYKIRSEHTLQYTLGHDGAFGKFVSEGKGDMTGKTGEGTSARNVHLTWNAMQMEPHPAVKDQVVLRLSRGITARMVGFGSMRADSLDLVCSFVPVTSPGVPARSPGVGSQKSNVILDHAIVKDRENVLFETASGTCRVKQLTIFFTNIIDGRALHSRWMPQMLTATPPVAPPIAALRPTLASAQPIQQVQHLQPLQTTPSTQLYPPVGSIPTTAPPYGNRMPNQLPQSQASRPVAGSVETQNLLGIKSSPSGGKFEMTGDQMWMRVRIQTGQSFAERVDIEGNVQLKENPINNLASTPGLIEIAGNSVTIWNPADPTTTISIKGHPTGGDAVFKGKGVELRAGELHISRPDNKFWSRVPGTLVANPAQINAPGIPTANSKMDNRLVVTWDKEMVCDGLVLQFEGKPTGLGNRVKVVHQAQTLVCDIMEIELNRQVMFFVDESPVEPKAVGIKFSRNVTVRNERFDAQGMRTAIDVAKVVHLHYDLDKNYFSADGPGEIHTIFLGSGQGFDRNLAGTPRNQNNKEGLNFLGVWFSNTMHGTLLGNDRNVDIRGRVEAVYCPVTAWNDTISRENISAARRIGYIMDCERLEIVEVPDPTNLSQSAMELTASIDARIDGGGMTGTAQRIMYNQAKETVQMDGNVFAETTIEGQRVTQRAESIRYNIATGAFEVRQVQAGGMGR